LALPLALLGSFGAAEGSASAMSSGGVFGSGTFAFAAGSSFGTASGGAVSLAACGASDALGDREHPANTSRAAIARQAR
jgi:hypothetical protein